MDLLAFELYLCQVYYRRMKNVCQQAMGLNCDSKIIISMFTQYTLEDIVMFKLQDVCEKLKRELRTSEPLQPMETSNTYEYLDPYAQQPNNLSASEGSSYTSLRLTEDTVEDDDLYGDMSAGNTTSYQHSPPPLPTVTTPTRTPPTAPPAFEQTSRPLVYDDNNFHNVKSPGGNHSLGRHTSESGAGSAAVTYAERVSSSNKRPQTGLVSSADKHSGLAMNTGSHGLARESASVGNSSYNVSVTASNQTQKEKEDPNGMFYKSIESSGERQILKDRNRDNVSSENRMSNVKRSHVANQSDYLHLETGTKQLNLNSSNVNTNIATPTISSSVGMSAAYSTIASNTPRSSTSAASPQLSTGRSSGYENVARNDTLRYANSATGQNIPSLYSTDSTTSYH